MSITVLYNDNFIVLECLVDEPTGSHRVGLSSKPLGNLLPDYLLKQGLPVIIMV